MSVPAALLAEAIALKKSAAIPLYTSPCSLTWVLHDYLITLEDEIRYIWPGPMNSGKLLFFWVRYYTLAALLFDVAQIHSFATFQPSLNTCVWMDAIIRVVGALSLWGVEIVMQLRIYALYRLSKRVAIINAVLFAISVGAFMWILIHNGMVRASVIAQAKSLPIPGCPVVHTGIEWAQWVPATIYEGILFGYALVRAGENFIVRIRADDKMSVKTGWRPTLYSVVLSDNLLYFFFIACILTFNNLMVVGVTHIPWFSYGPFHAATGIMTTRMLMHVRKAYALSCSNAQSGGTNLTTTRFGPAPTSSGSQPLSATFDIGSGEWRVAPGLTSSSGGTATTRDYTEEESYELKRRPVVGEDAYRVLEIPAGLGGMKDLEEDMEFAAPFTSMSGSSEGHVRY
ncbi:hypothetical protein OH77DRAFT_1517396 [Trametes cingulata]|nr:hypothetical protein OH77DRAFT_1517396 [Trametes cingulata]